MPLIQFLVALIVVGVILWLVNTYIPMNGTIKGILNVVVIVAVIAFTLNVFGLMGPIARFRIGR
jgi:hypothetical protein